MTTIFSTHANINHRCPDIQYDLCELPNIRPNKTKRKLVLQLSVSHSYQLHPLLFYHNCNCSLPVMESFQFPSWGENIPVTFETWQEIVPRSKSTS